MKEGRRMKFKFRADAKDVLIFIMFAVFLLYIIALGVINLSYLSSGEKLTLIPFAAFTIMSQSELHMSS